MGACRKLLEVIRDVNTLQLIEDAFKHRRMPTAFLISEQTAVHELEDVMSFWGSPWTHVTGTQLEKHFEAIFLVNTRSVLLLLAGNIDRRDS